MQKMRTESRNPVIRCGIYSITQNVTAQLNHILQHRHCYGTDSNQHWTDSSWTMNIIAAFCKAAYRSIEII